MARGKKNSATSYFIICNGNIVKASDKVIVKTETTTFDQSMHRNLKTFIVHMFLHVNMHIGSITKETLFNVPVFIVCFSNLL